MTDSATTAPTTLLRDNASTATPRRRVSVCQRFIRHRLALIGTTLLLVLATLSIAAPLIVRHDPYTTDLRAYRFGWRQLLSVAAAASSRSPKPRPRKSCDTARQASSAASSSGNG